MTNPLQAYALADRSVDTEDKGKVLVKVFQVMLEKLEIAKTAMASKDYATKCRELSKITTTLEVLIGSLDMSQGEIASNLQRLYGYVMAQIREAHVTLSPKTIDGCKEILTFLHDGFAKANDNKAKANADTRRKLVSA